MALALRRLMSEEDGTRFQELRLDCGKMKSELADNQTKMKNTLAECLQLLKSGMSGEDTDDKEEEGGEGGEEEEEEDKEEEEKEDRRDDDEADEVEVSDAVDMVKDQSSIIYTFG
eukprot:gene9709-7577_t